MPLFWYPLLSYVGAYRNPKGSDKNACSPYMRRRVVTRCSMMRKEVRAMTADSGNGGLATMARLGLMFLVVMMAKNGARRGPMKNRSQLKTNAGWTKRNTKNGRFMNVKSDNLPFKRVNKEG